MKKTNRIGLMVVDDHPAFRMGLISLIESQPDMMVVAEAGDGGAVVETFRQKQPDVVLMDLRLPVRSGVEAIIALRKEFPECRIIAITTYDRDEDIYRACQSGAQSYLLKDSPTDEILKSIRAVHAGQSLLSLEVAERLARRSKRENLSPREMEVLEYLVKGRSNKEIAAQLFVTEDTVKSHLKSLFVKLGVQDRTAAAVLAIRNGIVHLE
jgi:two-component system NarL family response regulator